MAQIDLGHKGCSRQGDAITTGVETLKRGDREVLIQIGVIYGIPTVT